ncbi:hypothetical protein CRG98_016361 [Punica granatum]|uniref:Uncharacterized protein n=1 Tax=Punica granatum TaxID=22663 RepID=A0A2I0K648_PUNGR|nr:hypothetical protein CRG98_016361 [Punica granatum]
MATFVKTDEMLAPKGLSMTISPLGSVCAVLLATHSSLVTRLLFTNPSSPGAQEYNLFTALIGRAAAR